MKHYSCSNCGFWQHFFDVPPFCPVCMDVRNDLPPNGWDFISSNEMFEKEKSGEIECVWREIDENIWMFSNGEPIGIGSSGYLILRENGNIAFESPGWWTQDDLKKLNELGGVRFASSSHPHGFGAFYQIQKQ